MKDITKYLLLLCLAALAPLLPSKAHADIYCSSPVTQYITSGGATVNNNASVGSVVWSGSVSFPTVGTNSSCSGSGYSPQYVGSRPYLGNNLYDTGIQGLAYRIYSTGGCVSGYYPLTCSYGSWGTGIIGRTVTVELVKTGPMASGSLSGAFATVNAVGSSGYVTTSTAIFYWSVPLQVRVVNPTCTVQTKSIDVPMGTVPLPGLPVGQTFNPVDFNILLNCSGGDGAAITTAYMTLTDATVPGNRTSTLNLGAGSTAAGVGIQVMHNGSPVKFGADSAAIGNTNQFVAGTSSNGNITVPFTAQYIITSGTVKPGQVKALATFTVGYQ